MNVAHDDKIVAIVKKVENINNNTMKSKIMKIGVMGVIITLMFIISVSATTEGYIADMNTKSFGRGINTLFAQAYNQTWLNFDGINDQVNFSVDYLNYSSLTIYTHYKSAISTYSSSTSAMIFSTGIGTGNTEWVGLQINGPYGKVRFSTDYGDDNCTLLYKDSLLNYTDTNWHSVIASISPQLSSNLLVDTFVSGYTSLKSCQMLNGNTNNWQLSRDINLYRLNGSIDKVVVYNNSLSSMQLNMLYNNLSGIDNIYIPVFYAHNINQSGSEMNTSQFDNFISYLNLSGYSSITDVDYYNWTLNRINISSKSFMIIFDDGQLSTITIAAPIMAKYGYRGVSAITTSLVGNCSSGLKCPWNTTSMIYQFMNWSQVRELVSIYNWSLASHSYLHCGMDGTITGTFAYGCNGSGVLHNMSFASYEIKRETNITPLTFVHPYNIVNGASFINCSLNYTLCFGSGSWYYLGASYLSKNRTFGYSSLTGVGELGRTTLNDLVTNDTIDWVINQTLPHMNILYLWNLNENQGITTYDSSSNGNNGTITGATWNNDGVLNTLIENTDYRLNKALGTLNIINAVYDRSYILLNYQLLTLGGTVSVNDPSFTFYGAFQLLNGVAGILVMIMLIGALGIMFYYKKMDVQALVKAIIVVLIASIMMGLLLNTIS